MKTRHSVNFSRKEIKHQSYIHSIIALNKKAIDFVRSLYPNWNRIINIFKKLWFLFLICLNQINLCDVFFVSKDKQNILSISIIVTVYSDSILKNYDSILSIYL